jgi:hypothetical protein
MNLAALIGVAVGLALVYLLLSLICSTIQEWIAAILRRRAATLREGLLAMIQNPATITNIYSHPLIQSLVPPQHAATASKRLAYMPSSAFAAALLETVVPQVLTPGANFAQMIAAAPLPNQLKVSLTALAARAGTDRDKFIAAVEKWFDDTMDRVSGWYKRRTQAVIIVIAVVTTIALNVDTVRVARELYANAGLREAVNAAANEYLAQNPERPEAGNSPEEAQKPQTDSPPKTDTSGAPSSDTTGGQSIGSTASQAGTIISDQEYAARVQGYLNTLTDLKLPIGWTEPVNGRTILGWLLTVVAVSLGAPFWFDVLMRVANLRANGPKPPKRVAD